MNHSPKRCPALLMIGSRADSYINSWKSWTVGGFFSGILTRVQQSQCSTVVPARTPEEPLKTFLTPLLSEVLSAALKHPKKSLSNHCLLRSDFS